MDRGLVGLVGLPEKRAHGRVVHNISKETVRPLWGQHSRKHRK